jgi:alanine racemase
MPLFSLSHIASVTKGQLKGNGLEVISKLIIDSRKVVSPNESLFIALKGANHDGHQYIAELIGKGVSHFMVNRDYVAPVIDTPVNFLFVDDTLEALHQLALNHRNTIDAPLLAITGSNGKTIVKEWIVQLAGLKRSIVRSPRSFNSQVGVPLSLWLLNEQADLGIIEAGISLPGEMARLEEMIHPQLGLITNIGQAHQENFSSIHEKLDEKLILFKDCQTIYYCADQALVQMSVKQQYSHKQLIAWGKDADCWLKVLQCKTEAYETRVDVELNGTSEQFVIPFTDQASFENAMHAITFLLHQGIDAAFVKEQLVALKPVAMRLEQKEGANGCFIINDAYNSDFTSLEVALDFLNQQARQNQMPRTIILSDIFQSGMSASALYAKVAALLVEKRVDRLIGVGPDIMAHASCFTGVTARFFASTDELMHADVMNLFHNEVILVKGSRDFSFERLTERLEQKRHQTVMEINLNALASNINYLRSYLKPETKMLAMVKAFSYGSGSFEIAGLLQHQKIDYLGVAFADEGIELRRAGISLPIIVMNPEKRSFQLMIEYNLEPEIYSFSLLDEFARVVEQEGLNDIQVHLKMDTGMYRLGFLPDEVPQLASLLQRYSHLRIGSVFSHLVGTDETGHDDFTRLQISRFKNACDILHGAVGYPFIRHILNTGGVERFAAEAQFEMVRIGIGMYGISAVQSQSMRHVATLKSYVSQIKEVKAGETIGYGRRGAMPADGRIAIVPMGYADGLDRRLSNGVGQMLVNGRLVPIIGNICMDMCMLNITGIAAEEGDEVIIFGDDYPVWKLSDAMGTIPYEVLTGISRRVRRVYYQE